MIAEWQEWWWIQWYIDLRWWNDWRNRQIYELRLLPWFKKSLILPSFQSFKHHFEMKNDHRTNEMPTKRSRTIALFRSLAVISFQNDKEMTNEDGMMAVTIFTWILNRVFLTSFHHFALILQQWNHSYLILSFQTHSVSFYSHCIIRLESYREAEGSNI